MHDQEAKVERQFLGQYEAAIKTVVAIDDSIRPPAAVCPRPEDCTRLLTLGPRQWRVAFAPAT